jgi:WD40 repeat protein
MSTPPSVSTTTTVRAATRNFTDYAKLKRTLHGHTLAVHSLTTLQNGDLVSGSGDRTIKIWNPNNGKLKRTLNGLTHGVRALATLQDGYLLSGSSIFEANSCQIKIWNPNNGELKQTSSGNTYCISISNITKW